MKFTGLAHELFVHSNLSKFSDDATLIAVVIPSVWGIGIYCQNLLVRLNGVV